jgi:hypothetical protein
MFLSATSLIKECTFYFPPNFSFVSQFPLSNNKSIPFNVDVCNTYQTKTPIIFIWFELLGNFIKEYICTNRIVVPFKIVTGISDFVSPYISTEINNKTYKILLDYPLLKKWFSINLDLYHPKVFHLPIGISRSAMFKNPNESYMSCYSTSCGYEEVENLLKKRFRGVKSMLYKPELLYANYTTENTDRSYYAPFINIRRKLDDYIQKSGICKKYELCSFEQYVSDIQKHKYCLAPPGAGIDSYRVFEAIILGCIPIILESPISHIYADLPVLIVKSYDTITREYLENRYESFLKSWNLDKLYLNYWLNAIHKDDTVFIEKPIWPRLGNQMFMYGVQAVFKNKNNVIPVSNCDKRDLDIKIFDELNWIKDNEKDCKACVVYCEKTNVYSNDVYDCFNTKLQGYFQSYKYFVGYENLIRQLYTFNSKTIQTVNEKIFNIFPNDCIKVGIHIRLPDIRGEKDFIYTIPSLKYIKTACETIARKRIGKRLVFLVYSNDIAECRILYKELSFLFYTNCDYELSLCALTLSNDLIITAGSFGWWGAYLNNKSDCNVIALSPWMKNAMNDEDQFPKEWIVLKDSD